ncbi:GlsB/YeaQ/YmgE family stress response membrane protein [Anabaena azotica]|uniref:GlsB/YeaQ/YmgE family stress response membrane protein n=1 Tax=Anabaena azotica FACHB-119 TaxID=947527 RepID=A0ABR8D2F7_9NOST|nr:GlsB/YeaQ/YmgE family stress response membrane protein [Anabaena azotica]MBD2501370.1 GlsB/YeaQ/YmgE family stress response membrane protein [Anabaena azotica FACHB-119]
MNIIAWIILGLIAGAIAKAIYPGRQGGGILGTMILGIIGALIGGTIVTLIDTGTIQLTASTLSISGIIVAIIGAIVAIFLWNLITGSSRSY